MSAKNCLTNPGLQTEQSYALSNKTIVVPTYSVTSLKNLCLSQCPTHKLGHFKQNVKRIATAKKVENHIFVSL